MHVRRRTASAQARPDTGRSQADSALIIFAKAPVAGQVKTRLCPPLTPDEAASLHGSMVLDMLERSRGSAFGSPKARGSRLDDLQRRPSPLLDRFLACAPSPDHVFFKILAERYDVRLLAQTGDDLGARMARAIADVFALGYRRTLAIGTDVPTLPPSTFGEALALLDTHDLVLGPAQDGGYYLIGLRQPAPELFEGIPWSTDRVLSVTQQKAAALGWRVALLPIRRDLDTVEDLLALIEEAGLQTSSNRRGALSGRHDGSARRLSPTASHLSPRTAGVLRSLAHRLRLRAQGALAAGRAITP